MGMNMVRQLLVMHENIQSSKFYHITVSSQLMAGLEHVGLHLQMGDFTAQCTGQP